MAPYVFIFLCISGCVFLLYALYQWSRELKHPLAVRIGHRAAQSVRPSPMEPNGRGEPGWSDESKVSGAWWTIGDREQTGEAGPRDVSHGHTRQSAAEAGGKLRFVSTGTSGRGGRPRGDA